VSFAHGKPFCWENALSKRSASGRLDDRASKGNLKTAYFPAASKVAAINLAEF